MSTGVPMPVRASRRLAVAPERAYDAFLDPAIARRFLFATPEGEMVRAETDARVGGRYAFVDRRDGTDVAHTGEYLELDRPRRLLFTFSVDGSPPDRVAVEIVPLEHGCEVMLTHWMAPEWAEYAARTEEGWRAILDGLADAVER